MAVVTVTDDSPLLVEADGADTAVPAVLVVGLVVGVGDRCIAEVRTPLPPLLTAIETEAV